MKFPTISILVNTFLLIGLTSALHVSNPAKNVKNYWDVTETHEYPSVVWISYYGSKFCEGSLLTSEWVLTMAHCMSVGASPEAFEVIAGDKNLRQDEGTEQRRNGSRIISHPAYNEQTIENDLALLRVSPPFDFNDAVGATEIAPPDYAVANATIAVGWPVSSGSSDALQKVNMPFIDDSLCGAIYGRELKGQSMLCAGGEATPYCLGSGNSLFHQGILVGVGSWGIGCGRPGFPNVYTEISFYYQWIQSLIQ